jgi:sporulation protein YlmC with PRC-barrel domain
MICDRNNYEHLLGGTRMKTLSILITLSLVLIFALSACAPEADNDNDQPGVDTPEVGMTAEATLAPEETEVVDLEPTPATVVTGTVDTTDLNVVSNLLGYGIENKDGDDLGTIDSLVVDRQGNLVYALLDPDDSLEIAGDLVAIPWNSFSVARADQNLDDDLDPDLVFNQDQALLAEAPSIDSGDDLDVTDATWDDDLFAYWGSRVGGLADTGADNENGVLRLRDVTDYQLLNADGDDIGDVEDMVLDSASKKIAYVIWAQGGILDIGEELIPVPFDQLSWERDNDDAFVLNVADAEAVQDAPRLDAIDMIDTSVENWDNEIRTWWNNFKGGNQPAQ